MTNRKYTCRASKLESTDAGDSKVEKKQCETIALRMLSVEILVTRS